MNNKNKMKLVIVEDLALSIKKKDRVKVVALIL